MIMDVNVSTGEVTNRPSSAAERLQADADRAAGAASAKASKDVEAARQAKFNAATTVAELKAALGLTAI